MKVIAGIATFDKRQEYLYKTMASISNQVDALFIYDNSKEEDITDLGKFYGLTKVNEPCYYFSCDDDIIYPKDYVKKMIEYIERYNGNAIITHHGRILKGFDLDYYRGHYAYSFERTVNGIFRIDVAGTGVTAFRTDMFNPIDILQSKDMRMSDLVFSKIAAEKKFPIYLVPHSSNYFQGINVPRELTCYGMEHGNASRQKEIANEIYLLNNGKK